ncbi:preprotein translocase subunit SecE [Actinoplanes sp. N902-109]|uniref:preprotein translocase subunit SecE n=1 Tax=Actinoplanes sp. (strain N902-109) TaxID=649831 RepID=UPI0003293B5F|nr:preprotein translocase subunit SecE [Actinoplanes sp. N902-109]AGL14420.1 preprotein translocase subunit SecE [Actinoplanes sp. N902-109]
MAERKRPGDDADRPGDETFDDAVAEDDAVADDVEADDQVSRGGGTAVRERTEDVEKPRSKKAGRRGGRIGGFFREVVGELRKVIWPTRKELLTYTGVVIAFVTVMTAIVAVLDYGFGKAILASFGN